MRAKLGHHRHRRGVQSPYALATVDQLLRDFLADVRQAKAARKMMEEASRRAASKSEA
jgi:hypothetical protein